MRQPVHPSYDPILLAATESWRFDPALKDGRPVRYRKFIPVFVHTRKTARIP